MEAAVFRAGRIRHPFQQSPTSPKSFSLSDLLMISYAHRFTLHYKNVNPIVSYLDDVDAYCPVKNQRVDACFFPNSESVPEPVKVEAYRN